MNPKQASTQCNREHNNCVTALIYRIRSQTATERSKILNRSKKNSNQMAKHQQLSGELFFGNIRTNINTTHTLGRTHKFTLEIIKSQAAGRPISLEYSKYQAINGNYCFDNIQCSCMHIFLSFFTDLFSSSFCSHIQIHAFWFLLHWTCNHFIEDAMQWVQIDFYFGFFFGNLKNSFGSSL